MNVNQNRVDTFKSVKPDKMLVELAAKLLEQNRAILNTNHMIFQTFAEMQRIGVVIKAPWEESK